VSKVYADLKPLHEGAARFAIESGYLIADIAHTLEAVVKQARSLEAVRKRELSYGDRVLVTTRNSLYTIWVLCDGLYWIWGGWFDRQGLSPVSYTHLTLPTICSV